MNILFLGYWNADDPLTSATIIPHLKIIKDNDLASNLIFTSIQREEYSEKVAKTIEGIGVVFEPLFATDSPFSLFNKFLDFNFLPGKVSQLIHNNNIDLVVSRGATAGIIAYLATKRNGIPFIAESYEPHAEYMREAGVWSRFDPRYLVQNYWEKQVKKYAKCLITVSENYKAQLQNEGVAPDNIEVGRCAVDFEKFKIKDNSVFRESLGIPHEAVVGIYAGKFGGLYYDHEAFSLFKHLSASFENDLYIIILSNISDERFYQRCLKYDLDTKKVIKRYVTHDQVNEYLNVADFALATYRKTKSARHLSPVKLGEYWAVGLPCALTVGVGDESSFLDERELGVVLDMDKINNSDYLDERVDNLKRIMATKDPPHFREFAIKYRSFELIKELYMRVLTTN